MNDFDKTHSFVWDYAKRAIGDVPSRGELEEVFADLLLRVVSKTKPSTGTGQDVTNGLIVDALASALATFYPFEVVAEAIAESEQESAI